MFKSLQKHVDRAKDAIDGHLSSGSKSSHQTARTTQGSRPSSGSGGFVEKASGFIGKAVSIGAPMVKATYKKGWPQKSSTKQAYKGSTIRDVGKGSGTQAFATRSGETPKTWQEIRDYCVASGSLWEDPDFPATDSSIYHRNPPSVWPHIEWKRPHEICSAPLLFDDDGANRMDVNQGLLGDCWLLAAVSDLATNQQLLRKVIPPNQSFSRGEYAGVFRFQFWQYGRWVEVLIDDRLPTHNGKLIYMHSDNKNEFWSALLEKAYAKVNGNYECLIGGMTSEALTDFTGGVVQRFELRSNAPPDLKSRMTKAHAKLSLMGCSIDAAPGHMESQLDNGLIIGHAYSVTDIKTIKTARYGQLTLVRCRNPWGNECEWTGPWGDKSSEWNSIDRRTREDLGLTFSNDGEFWMSFDDFCREFQRLEICYMGPDTLEDDDDTIDGVKMEGQLMEGSWRRRVNAGGCTNYPQTFYTNPQYRIVVEEPDEDDEDGKSTIIVGLMQKGRRKLRMEGKTELAIGYLIFKLDGPNQGQVDREFFRTHRSVTRSPAFINLREVCGNHALEPGHYVIVPSTFEPGEEADFILRVFSEKKHGVGEMDEDTKITEPDGKSAKREALGGETDDDKSRKDDAQEAFLKLAGADGELDAYELRDILNTIFTKVFKFDGFSLDMCRGMVALHDADLSGKLEYDDFKNLWKDLQFCQKAFQSVDQDKSGYFDSFELRRALSSLGLYVSNATFNAIVMRYSDKTGKIAFDDFTACYIRLKTMFATFKEKDSYLMEATFKLDEFIQLTMYS